MPIKDLPVMVSEPETSGVTGTPHSLVSLCYIRLNSACRDDIHVSWWINFLPQWNGVSLIRDTDWITSADIHLYTDASNIAVSGYFQGYLFVLPFKGQYAHLKRHSINFRELFAIVVALGTWSRPKCCFTATINLAIVHAIQNGSSKDINLMHLIRSMFFICAKYNVSCSAAHITSHNNAIADSLSRLQWNRFVSLAPHALRYPDAPIVANSDKLEVPLICHDYYNGHLTISLISFVVTYI